MYSRKAVLYDVANLAYVVGDVREGEYSAHSLHHTFDICAPGNIDRVNRVLSLAVAEVEAILNQLSSTHCCFGSDKTMEKLIRNLVHEYLVARVLTDWLTVAFPPGLSAKFGGGSTRTFADNIISIWKGKTSEARVALVAAVRNGRRRAVSRRVPPI